MSVLSNNTAIIAVVHAIVVAVVFAVTPTHPSYYSIQYNTIISILIQNIVGWQLFG